ncbi:MAG TPA: ATP-binding protein [Gemmataceae bacterium]|jgi:two-component system sensor histidine kinase HydH|nr:ATP-binding protein [Gemmataceae bacterium]
MPLQTYPLRILLLAVSTSVLVLAVAVGLAVYLNQLQDETEVARQENNDSWHAAVNLEETLYHLIALHRRNVREVEPLHERVQEHLTEIESLADKPEEKVLFHQLDRGFGDYLTAWGKASRNPTTSIQLADRLESQMIPLCRQLREYNSGQVEKSEREQRRALRRMTWGLGVIGGLTSLAGLVLGFGLSRGLRRTIHQLLIRVQGASELLSQELPPVEWRRAGDSQADEAQNLVRQVEQVVEKLQQREREVLRAERLAAVGQLAAGVGHEIRNPLTSIKLLIQTSRRDPSAGGLSEEDLDLIELEIQRLERAVQGFLDYARPPKLQRMAGDLAEMVRKTMSLVRGRAERQRVDLRFPEPSAPVILEADAEQLQQVLVNLMLNALDAMPHGGKLDIAVEPNEAGWVELRIRDTGSGIPAEILPRIFEPFVTGKETGLGLGLVVSKRIVEEHGGTIRASNLEHAGAEFTLRLPGTAAQVRKSAG